MVAIANLLLKAGGLVAQTGTAAAAATSVTLQTGANAATTAVKTTLKTGASTVIDAGVTASESFYSVVDAGMAATESFYSVVDAGMAASENFFSVVDTGIGTVTPLLERAAVLKDIYEAMPIDIRMEFMAEVISFEASASQVFISGPVDYLTRVAVTPSLVVLEETLPAPVAKYITAVLGQRAGGGGGAGPVQNQMGLASNTASLATAA